MSTANIKYVALKGSSGTYIRKYYKIFNCSFEKRYKCVVPKSYLSNGQRAILKNMPTIIILLIDNLPQRHHKTFINILSGIIGNEELDLLLLMGTPCYNKIRNNNTYTFDKCDDKDKLGEYYTTLSKMRTMVPFTWVNYFKQLIVHDTKCLYVNHGLHYLLEEPKENILAVSKIITGLTPRQIKIDLCPFVLRPSLVIIRRIQEILQSFEYGNHYAYLYSSMNAIWNICTFTLIPYESSKNNALMNTKLLEHCKQWENVMNTVHNKKNKRQQCHIKIYDYIPSHTEFVISRFNITMSTKVLAAQLINYANNRQ